MLLAVLARLRVVLTGGSNSEHGAEVAARERRHPTVRRAGAVAAKHACNPRRLAGILLAINGSARRYLSLHELVVRFLQTSGGYYHQLSIPLVMESGRGVGTRGVGS